MEQVLVLVENRITQAALSEVQRALEALAEQMDTPIGLMTIDAATMTTVRTHLVLCQHPATTGPGRLSPSTARSQPLFNRVDTTSAVIPLLIC